MLACRCYSLPLLTGGWTFQDDIYKGFYLIQLYCFPQLLTVRGELKSTLSVTSTAIKITVFKHDKRF